MTDSYRNSHLSKGPDYDERFSTYSFRRMSWRWEKQVLEEIANAISRSQLPSSYLDIACGTGRILTHLERHFDRAVGIDISSSMLGVAKQRTSRAQLILGDFTNRDLLGGERFDLLTAFRFFANAEPALRKVAVEAISALVRPQGYFVFNNHRTCSSLTFKLLSLKARLQGRPRTTCLDAEDVLSLARDCGFRLIKRYWWGIIPGNENWMLFPEPLQYPLERLVSSVGILRTLATYEILVCQKES